MTGSTAGPSRGSSRAFVQGPRYSKKPTLFLGAVLLLAALGLQACETPGPRSDAGNSQGNSQENTQAALGTPGTLGTLGALVPARVYPAPSTLSGLDQGQVVNLLGPPPFKRKDNPAEIWQYRAPACVLDLVLYRAGKSGSFRVRHFEARGRGKNGVSEKDCFHSFLKAHQARPSG